MVFSIFLYNPKVSKKNFFLTFLSISFSALLIYFFKGNKEAFFFENLVNEEINKLTDDPKSLTEINPQKIIFFLESKLEENPLDLDGWKLLARTCFMTGYTQKAEVHYTKALKHFPSNESLIYEYAVLKKNTDKFQGALNLLKKVDDHTENTNSMKDIHQNNIMLPTLIQLNNVCTYYFQNLLEN